MACAPVRDSRASDRREHGLLPAAREVGGVTGGALVDALRATITHCRIHGLAAEAAVEYVRGLVGLGKPFAFVAEKP